jgi:hypothetical protein
MQTPPKHTNHGTGQLLADLLRFQVKLLVDTARDLILVPLTFAAAGLDLALSRGRQPRYFYALLRFGERSEKLIDLWSVLYQRVGPAPENVDQVMDQIEAAIRDPEQGKRRARVLKRWLERRIRRQAAVLQTPRSPIPPLPPTPPPWPASDPDREHSPRLPDQDSTKT